MDDLFEKFKYMLRWLVASRIEDSLVWHSALSCFLCFIVADGVVDRSKYAPQCCLFNLLKTVRDGQSSGAGKILAQYPDHE